VGNSTISRTLGDFVAGLRFADLLSEVVENAKVRVLDTVGVCLVCSHLQLLCRLVAAAAAAAAAAATWRDCRRAPNLWCA